MVDELMGWGWEFAHMPNSESWRFVSFYILILNNQNIVNSRRHRKMFYQYFGPREVPNYEEIQLESTATLLRKLLDTPEDFVKHSERSVIEFPSENLLNV